MCRELPAAVFRDAFCPARHNKALKWLEKLSEEFL